MKSISVGKIKLPVLFALLFLFTSSVSFAQCEAYVPQPADLGFPNWKTGKRPANECETILANKINDSLRAAFRGIYSYNDDWLRINDPDSSARLTYLDIREDISETKVIAKDKRNFFSIKEGMEYMLFSPELDWYFNYRKREELSEFSDANKARLDQRAKLAQEGAKLKSSGQNSSPALEAIFKDIVLTDAAFWAENSFEINTYINTSDCPGDTILLEFEGTAETTYLDDSTRILHVKKSNKNIDAKKIIDGSLRPEDLIDEWYVLVGKWTEPVISTVFEKTTVQASVKLKHPLTLLDTHFFLLKIKASKTLAEEVISKIDLKPLKNLIYR